MLYDTHCHLNDESVYENVEQYYQNCLTYGIDKINVIGYDVDSCKRAIDIANKYPNCYAVIGMHPSEIPNNNDFFSQIDELYQEKRIVAVGEVGFDYHYGKESKERQKEVFVYYIKKAKELNLPLVVHSRDAHLDTLNTLKEYKDYLTKVVIHCYSYSKEVLKDYLDLGCYISLGGVVTFKNAKTCKEVASICPLDRLMLETDSPYLTPVPYRGQVNEPSYVRFVLDEIASIREMDKDELSKILYNNSLAFFNIK
ncbi:MAG: TatD family hydrolase [Bacilli bacterium]|nr:TatD family hydrolase [Bacilli bacterium]